MNIFLVKQTQYSSNYINKIIYAFKNEEDAIYCCDKLNKEEWDGENHFYTIEKIWIKEDRELPFI